MREPISVEKLCRKLEEERQEERAAGEKGAEQARERGLLEYILESGFLCAPRLRPGDSGSGREEEIGKKEEPPRRLAERKAGDRGVYRRECILR